MPNILALDLGTTTGWAMTINGSISSGSLSFKPTHFDSLSSRYTRFQRWLGTKACCGVEHVVFEAVRRHHGTIASQTYGGFMAALQIWCDGEGLAYEGVPVGTIKKHATGQGNASKLAMVEAMIKRGHSPRDDNEADALALLYWQMEAANRNDQARRKKPD